MNRYAVGLMMACACVPSSHGADAGADAGAADAGGTDAGTSISGVGMMSRLVGLWQGPATMTRLGDFPLMVFDLRPVGDSFLFGQTDMDSANLLRFGFNIESVNGPVLAYRNGGYFNGVLRDSRLALADSTADAWHFCDSARGCSYIDATFTQTGDSLVLDAKVNGAPHVHWSATRMETRAVPDAFPASQAPQGDGSEPWPSMASLQTGVSWSTPTSAPATAWIVLTTTPCYPTYACHPSRYISTALNAGATSASLTLTSVHAGSYYATIVVDLDNNFASTLVPSHGDLIAIDQAVTVPASGTATLTASANIVVP
jgi:hypothetical protein